MSDNSNVYLNIASGVSDHVENTVNSALNSSAFLINDASSVYNLREKIYDLKKDLAKAPELLELLDIIIPNPQFPPKEIYLSSSSIIIKNYIEESGTYNIAGNNVFSPHVSMGYIFGCALFSIIQDIYPKVYNFPGKTMSQLSDELEFGIWTIELKMNKQYAYQRLTPAITKEMFKTVPIENLPVEVTDPKAKKYGALPTVSLICGIISLVCGIFQQFMCFLILIEALSVSTALITGIISLTTVKDKHKGRAICGIIFAILSFIAPLIIGFIGIASHF